MKYKYIVWDFNGTIVDDVRIGIDSVNPLLAARGLKTIDSVEEYRKKFGFPIKEYYRSLGFDFDAEPYEVIAHEWVRNYKALEPTVETVPGVRELIDCLTDMGVGQMILSASEREMLEEKLEKLGLFDKFSHILALDNIYAHSKLDIAKAYFKDKNKEEYLMIGDTSHDAQVAREVGIDAVLVECGHHAKERLISTGYPVFDDMKQLLEHIKSGD
ncbi:MAG: HAD family hydrolase [Clostridia bacterium]|nr:HAD family hydrolase [Clostridia bacterium]